MHRCAMERAPTPDPAADDLWTVEEAASYVLSTSSTLATLRSRGGGPAFYKGLGRKVRYRRHDLDAWIASRRVEQAPRTVAPHDASVS